MNSIEGAKENADLEGDSLKRIYNRIELSLIVWANYLFSFSIGMNACSTTSLFREFPAEPTVMRKDLTLLVGTKLASEVVEMLNRTAVTRAIEPLLVEKYYDTEMYVSEESVSNRYKSSRYFISMNSDNLGNAIDWLFEAHLNPRQPKFLINWTSDSRLPLLGETIASIIKLMDYRHNKNERNFILQINKNIDIDEGRISPFYHKIQESSGIICWQRFHKGGSRSII